LFYVTSVINCVNFNPDRTKPKSDKVPLENLNSQKNKQLFKIKKLQDLGLTHNEIAEFLEIPLESVTSLDLEESV
jgi:hypothetical protein